MVSVRDYCKAFLRSRDIRELIPPDTFVSDHACITKGFSAVAGFSLSQLDDECLNREEVREQVEDMIAALNLLDPNYQHFQVLFRSRGCAIPTRTHASHSPAVLHLEDLRQKHLEHNTKTATIEIAHLLELLPNLNAKAISRTGGAERRRILRRTTSDLDLTARAYTISLPALDPQRMDKHALFKLFWRLLYPGCRQDEAPELSRDTDISGLLRHAPLYWDDHHGCLRAGRRFVRVFSLAEWPDASEANLFGEMLKIDADMTVVTTWQQQERLATQAQLIALRNLKINIERDTMGMKRKMRDDPQLREVLQGAGVQDDLRDIQKLLLEMRRKRHAGLYSMVILLHADSLDELEKPAVELDRVYRLPMARLYEEHGQWAFGNVLPVFASVLPGNGHFVALRAQPLRNDHHAELTTIWGSDTGYTGNDFAAQYNTRLGPVYRMARKHRMVANRACVGRTRSGKTLAEIDYIGSLQVHRPMTRIYDASRSYEPITRYFHGDVLRCSLGEWNVPLAPFAGDLDDANHREFCRDFVQFLAEAHGYECDYLDLRQINKRLDGLFDPQVSPEFRRLRWLHSTLDGKVKHALEPWIEGGPYGHLFDHAVDRLEIKEFQLYQFESVQDGSRHAYLEALLLLLIHRDMRTIMNPARLAQIKHFTFDEIMSLCKTSPRLATFIQRILQGMQKYNAALSLVSQSPEDYGTLEPFILQNCTSFCFFKSDKISDEMLHRYGMDEARRAIYRGLKDREFLYHALGGRSGGGDAWKVLRLDVDPYRYWLATTTPEEVVQRERLFQTKGQTDGLNQLAATAQGAA